MRLNAYVLAPDFAASGGSVAVEDYAYIASEAAILPGVRVGVGGVVAAGAMVIKNGLDDTLVAGVPARLFRERFRDLTYRSGNAKRLA